jgi:hypothetical protein
VRKDTVKKIIFVVVIMALLFGGLTLFNKMANDDLGDYDGGRGEIVDRIENM